MASLAATVVQGGILKTTAKFRPDPSLMLLPGLTSKPFHDPADFPWTRTLSDNLDVIRGEFKELMSQGVPSDYVTSSTEHQLHSGAWSWHSLVTKGKLQADFASRCPATTALVTNIEGLLLGLPFAYAFFSTLPGGSKIAPHRGPSNLRVRCHFPLFVPDGCRLRVGEETRVWEEGQCLLFDDSYEHEVVHDGTEDRVVLLLDVWHPEVEAEERRAITGMFDEAREKGWIS